MPAHRLLLVVLGAGACRGGAPGTPPAVTNAPPAPPPVAPAIAALRPLDGPYHSLRAATGMWPGRPFFEDDGDRGEVDVLAHGAAGAATLRLVRTDQPGLAACAIAVEVGGDLYLGPGFVCEVTRADEEAALAEPVIAGGVVHFTLRYRRAPDGDPARLPAPVVTPAAIACDPSPPRPRCTAPPVIGGYNLQCNQLAPPAGYCPPP